jgi:hypothetical protein
MDSNALIFCGRLRAMTALEIDVALLKDKAGL